MAATFVAAFATSAAAQTPVSGTPWVARDIGAPALGGGTSLAQGVFTIDAAGADIWGSTDQFHFVYQPITGDVDIAARIDSVTAANPWSKAGVMIRKSLTSSSAHALALVSSAYGSAFQRRLADGGSSSHTSGPAGLAPRWVRLVRAGTRVTAYTSADGATWTTIGSDTISLGSTAYVGLAVTSHNTAVRTTAKVSRVTVAAAALPAGQQARDIGSPGIAGSTSYQSGVYTIRAGGADIWDVADQFHFVSQPVSGDVDVVLRVSSISAANAWSKAGVMIRESLTAGSRHASMFASAGKGYAFQRRLNTDGISSHTAGPASAPPGWVRLVRKGTRFEAFQSSTGTAWTSIGVDNIAMADSVYVGIAVTSHNTTAATTAVVDHFSVSAAAATANQPPSVTLTAPASAATFAAPATVALSATAADPDGAVSRVDFFHDGTLIASDATSPYSVSWSNVAAGTYTLTAAAYDGSGASTTSNAVTITVTGTTTSTAPTAVAFQASADHATVTSYRLDIFATSANPATATPVATSDLGKPAPDVNNAITVNRATFFAGLAAGSYQATVTAISPSGSGQSSSVSFTR